MESVAYRHLYGPVPSRRLGLSLGVDIVPYKVCSFDCVYCQLGRTTKQIIRPELLVPADEVVAELERWLSSEGSADFITFAGSGEPTLNSDLAEMIERSSRVTDIPIAVITNGSLLYNEEVLGSVLGADLLIPSLDAGTADTFRKINRPCDELDFEKVVKGLASAKQRFRGAVWLEVMLVQGLNDGEAELLAMKSAIDHIRPDKVQISTVDRPSGSGRAPAVTQAVLDRACELLGPTSEVVSYATAAREVCDASASKEIVLGLLSRRPCRLGDITAATGVHINEVVKTLRLLMSEGMVESVGKPTDPHYRVSHLEVAHKE